jgi:hypothetical protein
VRLNLESVPVVNGIAQVDLSRSARLASDEARISLSEQLVWTLAQISDVTSVNVTAAGEPFLVPGVASPQPRDAWPAVNPDAMPVGTTGFVAQTAGVVALTGQITTPVPGPAGTKLYLGPARDARQASEARKASVSGGPQNQRGPLAAGPTEANRPGGQWQDLGRGWGALAQFLRVTPALASGQEQARGAGGGDRQSGGERGGSAAEQARAPGSPRPGPGSEGARERQRYRDSRRLSFDFAAFPN